MADILDITPVPKEINTHKFGKLSVPGLGVNGVAFLIKNHPEIYKIFSEGGENGFDLDVSKIIDLSEEVFASFVAAGLGHPGNEEVIEKCKQINLDDAWTICDAILKETLPGGTANFFDRVVGFVKDVIQSQEFALLQKKIAEETENLKIAS